MKVRGFQQISAKRYLEKLGYVFSDEKGHVSGFPMELPVLHSQTDFKLKSERLGDGSERHELVRCVPEPDYVEYKEQYLKLK